MSKEIKTTVPATRTTAPVPVLGGAGDDISLAKSITEIQTFPILSAQQEYEYATKWVKEHDAIAAEIQLDIKNGAEKYEMYLLDEDHDNELVGTVKAGDTLTLKPQSVVYLKSV